MLTHIEHPIKSGPKIGKMASTTTDMSFWIKFFKDCGIPAGDSANYAVTFTDNRITRAMLTDLNKEYLNDMGITILGDVIAILKHCKLVYSQDVRDKAIRDTSRPSARVSTPTPEILPGKPSTPASRTIGHYIGTERSASPSASTKISKELSARLGTSATVAETNPTVIRLGVSKTREEVPVPKTRRVFPEHEGKYKVSMPAGTTAKTRTILEQQRRTAEQQRIKAEAVKQKKSASVFARLGNEKPAVVNDKSKANEPTITITGLGNLNIATSSASSVFTRLGGKTTVKRPATSTVVCDDDDDDDGAAALEYAGILNASPSKQAKLEAAKKIKKTAQKRLTIRAPVVSTTDAAPATEGVLSADAGKSRKDIKSRLGRKVSDEVTSTTQKVPAAKPKPSTVIKTTKQVATTSSAVTSRLGPSVADMSIKIQVSGTGAKTSKGVFGRLGSPKGS